MAPYFRGKNFHFTQNEILKSLIYLLIHSFHNYMCL